MYIFKIVHRRESREVYVYHLQFVLIRLTDTCKCTNCSAQFEVTGGQNRRPATVERCLFGVIGQLMGRRTTKMTHGKWWTQIKWRSKTVEKERTGPELHTFSHTEPYGKPKTNPKFIGHPDSVAPISRVPWAKPIPTFIFFVAPLKSSWRRTHRMNWRVKWDVVGP